MAKKIGLKIIKQTAVNKMSGKEKSRNPPNLKDILKSKKYNPSTNFPDDLLDKIFLCDRDAPKPDEYRELLDKSPVNKPFPKFEPPYDAELYGDKDDKKALNDKRVSELARIEEISKRKKRIKELKNIYEEAKEKFESELKSIQAARSQPSPTKEIQKILDSSKNRLDSSDDDNNSNDSFSDNDDDDVDDESSNSDDRSDHYESSDSDDRRREKRQIKEKPQRTTKTTKSDKKDDSRAKKTRQNHEPDKERNYQIVISGRNTSVPFVDDVYNQQLFILQQLKRMNDHDPSDETQRKIKEQEVKVNNVLEKLKQLSKMPEPSMIIPTNNNKTEKTRERENYQRKLDLANKEIEKEKNESAQQNKIESASSRASAIDEKMSSIFGQSDDDSNSSDSDEDILKNI